MACLLKYGNSRLKGGLRRSRLRRGDGKNKEGPFPKTRSRRGAASELSAQRFGILTIALARLTLPKAGFLKNALFISRFMAAGSSLTSRTVSVA